MGFDHSGDLQCRQRLQQAKPKAQRTQTRTLRYSRGVSGDAQRQALARSIERQSLKGLRSIIGSSNSCLLPTWKTTIFLRLANGPIRIECDEFPCSALLTPDESRYQTSVSWTFGSR